MSVQELKEQALKLSVGDREWLAQELWNTVDFEEDPEVIAELNRRWEEIVTGKVETIPWEQVKAELHEKLAKMRAERPLTSES
jgi:putative addiction module component (TIGR02574 family)